MKSIHTLSRTARVKVSEHVFFNLEDVCLVRRGKNIIYSRLSMIQVRFRYILLMVGDFLNSVSLV